MAKIPFTQEMKDKGYTIAIPNMSPIHFNIMKRIFINHGFRPVLLENSSPSVIREGLKYVHNDMCYPCLLVIGQIIDAINRGIVDKDHTAVIISQTGGGCRASNYYFLLIKALERAGLGNIPVISANLQGMNANPGFQITLPMLVQAFTALVYGDLKMLLSNQVRPYEINKGDKYAETLKLELSKQEWQDELNAIEERISNILTKKDFEKCTKQLEQLFDSLYEKMTAPGLDAFVSWVEEHTKNNENNIAKLRDFLKGNYETYSSRIDSILSTLENISFDDDKCIFDKIISEFNKKLKSDVSAFVNKPDEFENNIDGFLTDLEDEFVGLADISELAYTKVEDLSKSQELIYTKPHE